MSSEMKWSIEPGLFLTVGRLRELLSKLPDDWTVWCVRSSRIRPVEAVRLHPSTQRVSFDYTSSLRSMDFGYDGDDGGCFPPFEEIPK